MNLTGIDAALFFNKQFEDAAANLLVSLQHLPKWVVTYRYLATAYAHLGRLEETREIVQQLRTLTPLWCPSSHNIVTQSTASCSCRDCAWRRARRREPDPPPLGSSTRSRLARAVPHPNFLRRHPGLPFAHPPRAGPARVTSATAAPKPSALTLGF